MGVIPNTLPDRLSEVGLGHIRNSVAAISGQLAAGIEGLKLTVADSGNECALLISDARSPLAENFRAELYQRFRDEVLPGVDLLALLGDDQYVLEEGFSVPTELGDGVTVREPVGETPAYVRATSFIEQFEEEDEAGNNVIRQGDRQVIVAEIDIPAHIIEEDAGHRSTWLRIIKFIVEPVSQNTETSA